MPGALGAANAMGVTVLDKPDAAPKPAALIAETWNRYAVPAVSPLTMVLVVFGAAGPRRPPTCAPRLSNTLIWYPVIA